MSRPMRSLWVIALLFSALALGCGEDDDAGPAGDVDGAVLDTRSELSDTDGDAARDAEASQDSEAPDTSPEADLGPECASVSAAGFFPDCTACLDPTNCDTVDAPGASGKACGCNDSADCPCGLECGSYEIAPGVSMGGICLAP